MKNKITQIGITGGIGAGKSIVCKIFRTMNVPIYDADTMAKWLMNHHEGLKKEVMEAFGEEAYTNGTLNRRYLAGKVFNDKDKIKQLNHIVHPKVGEHYQEWVSTHQHTAAYVMKEAALLFESGSYKQLDKVITVFAPQTLRVKRTLQRDPQRTEQEVQHIISKQMQEDERQRLADYIIYNDEKQLLLPQVLQLNKVFKNL